MVRASLQKCVCVCEHIHDNNQYRCLFKIVSAAWTASPVRDAGDYKRTDPQ